MGNAMTTTDEERATRVRHNAARVHELREMLRKSIKASDGGDVSRDEICAQIMAARWHAEQLLCFLQYKGMEPAHFHALKEAVDGIETEIRAAAADFGRGDA
jgi:hypothetical protein